METSSTKSWCLRCGSYSQFENPTRKIIKSEKVLGGKCSQCSAFKFLIAPKSSSQSNTQANKAYYYLSLIRFYLGELQRYLNVVAFVCLLNLGGYFLAKAHFGLTWKPIDQIIEYTAYELENLSDELASRHFQLPKKKNSYLAQIPGLEKDGR